MMPVTLILHATRRFEALRLLMRYILFTLLLMPLFATYYAIHYAEVVASVITLYVAADSHATLITAMMMPPATPLPLHY